MDIEAEISALQSRVAKLEAGVAVAPAQPAPAAGSGAVAAAVHPSDFASTQPDGTPIARAPDGTLPPSRAIPAGYQWGWSPSTGWAPFYLGNVGHNPEQDFINAGGNVAQWAGFQIFVQKSPELAGATLAAQMAAFNAALGQATADAVHADTNPTQYPADWRTRKLTVRTDAKGNDVGPIVDNYNGMIDAGMSVDWYVPYLLEASPTQYFNDPAFGREIQATLYACFTGTGSPMMRASLQLTDVEGQPGGVKIAGGKFIITRSDGSTAEYVLPFGGLSVHNGFPEVL